MIAASDNEIKRRFSVLWVNQAALLPQDGGGTRHFELGRELVRRGWQVTILASDLHLHRRTYTRRVSEHSRDIVKESFEGVDLQWIWAAAYWKNDWRRVWNWLSFAHGVRKADCSLARPDIVVGSSPQLFAAHAARAVARRFGVPFIFEVRDLWPESLLAVGGKQGVAYNFLDRLAKSLYRDAVKIIVLAQGVRNYLVERGVPQEKIVYVPNGVDVRAAPIATSAIPEPGADDSLVLIYAGAHGPANGLDQVLAAAEMLRAVKRVRFILIGDGPIKAELVADAVRRKLTNIEFLDPVAKKDLGSMLAEAGAGLMVLRDSPLFSFGVSPNKLFDYLAAGIPVICNVPGEVAGMLVDAGAGIQVADPSGAALAAGIRHLIEMRPEERRRQGLAGRSWVEREHSREILGRRLDGFLRGVIEHSTPP